MAEIMPADDGGNTCSGCCDVGGYRHPVFDKTPSQIKKIFENMPNFPLRDDDYLLCSFPKTGTTWIFEIMVMILNQSAERPVVQKMELMLESKTVDQLDRHPSPRVLNTHYLPRYLPKLTKEKKTKTVLCLRNPRDAAVSYFNYMKGFKYLQYTGKWEDWLHPYLEGMWNFGKYADYLNEWQSLIEQGAEFPLHVVYFEDLKENVNDEISRLAKFLEVDLDDTLKADIIDKCSFANMKEDKFKEEEHLFRPHHSFYRKGEVGDWKKWFTVAQNEMFNSLWSRDIRSDTIFNFKYSLM